MIDFKNLPLSPNESRGARNFLGLSQAQASTKADIPAYKLKRFEAGNYVPDVPFLQTLRDFYEGEGFDFADEDAPGAKAKARGDVFPAGVVERQGRNPGETAGFTGETGGSTKGTGSRAQAANVQYMRINPNLDSDQIDRILDCIEDNETEVQANAGKAIETSFFGDAPNAEFQARAIADLRRLAENGLLHAQLLGRDVLQGAWSGEAPKTIGDLMQAALGNVKSAIVDGDKDALAKRKARPEPTEVLQALVG